MLLSEAWLDEFQLCIIRKHINHTSWNIYDNSHTSHNFFPLFQGSVFSGTHSKGVSKQLCVYQLHRNVFLAQTRIRSHLGQWPGNDFWTGGAELSWKGKKKGDKRSSSPTGGAVGVLSWGDKQKKQRRSSPPTRGAVKVLSRGVLLAPPPPSPRGLTLAVFSSLETCFNTHYQNAFRNAFLELLCLSSISQYREYESRGRFCHCAAAVRNFIRNTMHLKAFQNNLYKNVFLAQTRIRSSFFLRFRKPFLTP